jgi:competence protein ComGC
MKPRKVSSARKAFTLVDLLVLIVVIGVMVMLFYPSLKQRHARAPTTICVNNLRLVGLALRMYAMDNLGQFPWQISTNSSFSATSEILESRSAAAHFLAFRNYGVASPSLVCPSDKARVPTTNYLSFSNTNLSYFVALSATTTSTNPLQLILAGDRHLSKDGKGLAQGLHALAKNSSIGWTKELHPSGRGVVVSAAGHISIVPTKKLSADFKNQPVETTRLAIP